MLDAVLILQLQLRPKECKARARPGDILRVHYTVEDMRSLRKLLTLAKGSVRATGRMFDSSLLRGEPFEFQLGAGRVMPGTHWCAAALTPVSPF